MGRRIRRRYAGRRKSERSRSKLVIFLVLLFTAAVVFLSVLLGLDLREKAEKRRQESEFMSTAETESAVTKAPASDISVSDLKIQAPFVSVSDKGDIDVPQGAAAVSTVFKSRDGVGFYRSGAIEAVSGPQSEDLPSAERLIETLSEGERSVSVIFHKENTEGMDGISAQALLDIEVSQMCEIAKAGADEILLMGFDTGDAGMEFLSSSATKIKAAAPEALVGIVLPAQAAAGESETFSALCRKMAESFDIIALDMTRLEDSESQSAEDQLGAIADKLQICFVRYNIRCILRDGYENGDLLARVLEEAMLANYQFTSETGLKTELVHQGDESDA